MISLSINAAISLVIFAVLSGAAIKFIRRYKTDEMKLAAWKAFFLWLVTTSPVLASIALSSPNADDGEIWRQFFKEIWKRLTLTEMFVYSAAFIAPMLYVIFEVAKAYKANEIQLTAKEVATQMRGMESVFLTSIVILILTLIAYAGAGTNSSVFSGTYLSIFLQQKGYILYIASLLIWYSVILWENGPPSFSLENAQKNEAQDFSDKLARRRGKQNDR